jgi:hypothetical protein
VASARRVSKKERCRIALSTLLVREAIPLLDEKAAVRLRAELPAMSDRMYRDLLRDCGLPLSPLVEGVRQDDFVHLERTLLLLAQEYEQGDLARRKQVRSAVIEAKNHARLAAANEKVSGEKRAEKDEMVLWTLTWLENPSIFELWVGLRKAQTATEARSFPPL